MARDVSELGADVFDDTVVEKKSRISPKKRNYIIGLSITAILVAGLATAYAVLGSTVLKDFDTIPYLEFYYNAEDPITGEVTATVACLRKELHETYPANFRIPSKINGHRITRIEDNAFNDCTLLEKVIMTDNIEYIGAGAFNDCVNLKEFTFSKNLSYIGSKAFSGTEYEKTMSDESTVVLNDQFILHVGKNAFANETVLLENEYSTIPEGFESYDVKYFTDFAKKPVIGFMDGCFEENTNLVYVEIPQSLINLPDECFLSCQSLKSVDLSKTNISSLSNSAFRYCSSLSSIKLSDNLITDIGNYCFAGTKIEAFPDGLDNLQYVGSHVFEDCAELESFIYPKKLTSIPDYAFSGCSSLTTFAFEEDDSSNILSIGCNAFEGTKISSFKMPRQISSIRGSTFENCSELKKVELYENSHPDLTCYDLIAKKDKNDKIIVDENGYIEYDEKSTKLLDYFIELPYPELDENGEVVTFIGEDEQVYISYEFEGYLKGVSTIYDSAFAGCSKLDTIALYGDDGALIPSKNKEGTVYMPCTLLTTLGYESRPGLSFKGTNVTEFIANKKLTSICDSCFEDVSSLTTVTFEEGNVLDTIGNRAFKNTSLTSIDIPNTVTTIGVESFMDCHDLTEVFLPEKLNEDDKGTCTIAIGAFQNCTSLHEIDFKNKVSKIGEKAFSGSGLVEAIISDSVGTVDANAFANCTSLTKVRIPGKTKEIGNSAFSGCVSLANLELTERTSKIGKKSFENCSSLESIVLPKSVITIIGDSFAGCTNLTSIYSYAKSAQTGWAAGWNQDATIYYYSETEAEGCWHMVENVPTLW